MRFFWTLVALLFVATGCQLLQSPAGSAAPEYDLLILDGRVMDGSGIPWRRADVAVSGDRIAALGDLSEAQADTVIDASGSYVTPGFIDVHSHAASGLSDPELSTAEPLLAQGITTVVVNPDGGGAVDLEQQRDTLLEHGLGVNVAQLVPHGSIREEVMGMEDRAPTEAEMEEMKELVRAGMEEGGVGLSSGPFYSPGSYADTEEFVALSRVASEYDGVYQSHIRDESNYTIGVVSAVDEVIQVAEEADLPGIVTHIKALGPPVWGESETIVHRIEEAREDGVEVLADQYPYTASATSLSAALVPRWGQVGGRDSLEARIQDEETRQRMLADMEENLARRGGADRIQFRTYDPDPSIEGRTLEEVAANRDEPPLEAALSLIEEESPGIVSFNMHEKDVHRFMQQSWTMTSSDGGLVERGEGVPHPRNYGAFPRKLRKYALEENVIELGFALRSMTHLSAATMGISERGFLRPGAYADIVVFDPDRVRDRAEFQNPHQLSEGIDFVVVNGTVALFDGEVLGVRPGRVLSNQGE